MKIIFDPGSCHMGKLGYALELIDMVKNIGADAIKFQLFKGRKNGNIELPRRTFDILVNYSRKIGLDIFASVFDEDAIDLLHDCGITKIKLAYSQNFNLRLIRKARKLGMQIWASGDMERYPHYADIKFFCKPEYPPQKLPFIDSDRAFQWDGLSSHYLGYKTDLELLNQYKFEYLEKHITLDYDDIDVPDHWFALLPNEAKEMVQCLKKTNESL